MATFTALASKGTQGRPQQVELSARLDTAEEAQALFSIFPKSYRARVEPVRTATRNDAGDWTVAYYLVTVSASFRSIKGNDVNETGIKRYRAAMAKLEQAGHTADWTTRDRGEFWFHSREELDAALDAQLHN